MLIKCPECELQVSDKAIYCPHCGYPMRPETAKTITKKYKKHRRLPNGFGQISEIKGKNLRKPFRAMVTVGKTPDGKPICKSLKPETYFATYNDAYTALIEYHKNPYDLDSASTTVEDLYNRWMSEYEAQAKSRSRVCTMKLCWGYCSSVSNMLVKDLRARHIKSCMTDGIQTINGEEHKVTANTQYNIKSMFNLMLDYAVEYELVDRNYARTFTVSEETAEEAKKNRKSHIPFTAEEMEKLWKSDLKYADLLIFQCYTGFRPQELGLIRLENVDLENWTVIGGIKTKAGTDRIVPIHSKVRPIVQKYYDEAKSLDSDFLFNYTKKQNTLQFTYDRYETRFRSICKKLELNPEHRPHDPRCTFVTMAKDSNVDEYAIKYIVGHAINDLTEKVYTTRPISWLREEIEKIE